jgi:hypothetical protein
VRPLDGIIQENAGFAGTPRCASHTIFPTEVLIAFKVQDVPEHRRGVVGEFRKYPEFFSLILLSIRHL